MSAAALLLLMTPAVEAKDLQGRVGVGFAAALDDQAALTVRYGLPVGEPPTNMLVEVQAGVDLQGAVDDSWLVGARVLYAVVAEDNLNLYAAVGGAWVSTGGAGRFRLQPALSAEWFAFGLENLGLSAQWGLAVDFGGGVDVRTFGGGPGLGLHYYF